MACKVFSRGREAFKGFKVVFKVFPLKNCGITLLKTLRHTVFSMFGLKSAVIDKNCLRYYEVRTLACGITKYVLTYQRPHPSDTHPYPHNEHEFDRNLNTIFS